MPRTTDDIAAHAEELATRFENDDWGFTGETEYTDGLEGLSRAVIELAGTQKNVTTWVQVARHQGKSWAAIGTVLGTTGEAARQRYAPKASA